MTIEPNLTQNIMKNVENLPTELIKNIADFLPEHKYMKELKILFEDCKNVRKSTEKTMYMVDIEKKIVKYLILSERTTGISDDYTKNLIKNYNRKFNNMKDSMYFHDKYFCKKCNKIKGYVDIVLRKDEKKNISVIQKIFLGRFTYFDEIKKLSKNQLLSIAGENSLNISYHLTKQKIIAQLIKSL